LGSALAAAISVAGGLRVRSAPSARSAAIAGAAFILSLLVEGALGGAGIALATRARRRVGALALAGAVGALVGQITGSLAGLPLLLLVVASHSHRSPFFHGPLNLLWPVLFEATVGATVGLSLGWALGYGRKALWLACAGAVGFALGWMLDSLSLQFLPVSLGAVLAGGVLGIEAALVCARSRTPMVERQRTNPLA